MVEIKPLFSEKFIYGTKPVAVERAALHGIPAGP